MEPNGTEAYEVNGQQNKDHKKGTDGGTGKTTPAKKTPNKRSKDLDSSDGETLIKKTKASFSSKLLTEAVSDGDHLRVQKALDDGASPDTCMPWQFGVEWGGKHERVPILTLAAHKGFAQVVTVLLDAKHKAKTENRGDFGVPPISMAIASGHSKIVDILLEKGANPHARNSKNGWYPIHYAARYGQEQIAKILKLPVSSLEVADKYWGGTPLQIAAGNGHKATVEWLIQEGVKVAIKDNDGDTAADRAASNGHTELESWLRSREHSAAAAADATHVPISDTMDEDSDSDDEDGAATDEEGTAATLQILQSRVHGDGATQSCISISKEQPMDEDSPPATPQIRGHKKQIFIFNFIKFPFTVTIKFGENNCKTLRGDKTRQGASYDSENLRVTFKGLGYDVINIYENKSTNETNNILDNIQQNKSLDFLVLAILSHGYNELNEDIFMTSDGGLLSLRNIQQMFTDNECPNLKGKEKVILANFCRGNKWEEIEHDNVISSQEQNVFPYPVFSVKDQPPHNMRTIFSSHEGFYSLRCPEKGTKFVQALCEVLRKDPDKTIEKILNLIHSRMMQNLGTSPEMRTFAPVEDFIF